MIFLISLALAWLLVLFLKNILRKHAGVCYGIGVLISFAVILVTWCSIPLPSWFFAYIWPVFARGGLAGALFVLVMVTGALPNGSSLIKLLMPLRAPLSILACILSLGHNIAYGKTYFVMLFTDHSNMPWNQLLAAVCSVVMLLIMLPLFVTSFPSVRKRMSARKWKRLQRWAYLFYGLLYCHIMLLNFSSAWNGNRSTQATVMLYTLIFGGYVLCRICKAKVRKNRMKKAPIPYRWIILAWAVLVALFQGRIFLRQEKKMPEVQASEIAETTETTETPETTETYPDGVYSGSAMGMNAPITVSVTVSDGRISDIVIESSRDDEPYFSDALYVVDDILACGSTEVDTISGATYSSGGIIDAVQDALSSIDN
jgi:DMSO/TMAO reductase YedYZ heme-binding membrane subunit/uncharacterized protein with FMN-binding domain